MFRVVPRIHSFVLGHEMVFVVVAPIEPLATQWAAQVELALTLLAVAHQVVHLGVHAAAFWAHKSANRT